MALLTKQEVAEYALRTGHIYCMVCDTPGCGHLMKPGELFQCVKSEPRKDKLTFLGHIPIKVRCTSCTTARKPQEITVRGAGRGSKKVSQEEASKYPINQVVRKAVVSLLKKNEDGLTKDEMSSRLKRKKAIREVKKAEVSQTIRSLKKLKVIKFRAGKFLLVQAKTKIKKKKRRIIK